MQAIQQLASRVRLQPHEFAVLALALMLAGACAVSAWIVSGGHFMLPLDDSYIHLQYARQLARIEVFAYTPGADPSGGATSPLWAVLLAPIFLLGIKGVLGAIFAFVLCTVIWSGTALLLGRMAQTATSSPASGFATSLLFLLNGHLLWNFVNGMETGLFTLLILAVIATFPSSEPPQSHTRNRRFFFILALLPICRPEGFILSGVALCLYAWSRSALIPHPRTWLVFIPGFLWLGVLKVLTGEWKPAGLLAKGLMERSDIGLVTKFRIMSETLVAIPTRFYRNIIPDDGYALFKGTDYLPYLPQGIAFLALAVGAHGAVQEIRQRRPGPYTLTLTLWMAGLASLAVSGLPFIHQQRYLVPWTPLIILLAVIGIRRASEHLKLPAGSSFAGVAVFAILSAPSVPFWIVEYGRNSSDIYRQHRVMTFSIDPTEHLAVTDTGVLAYYTNAATVDLVGLTSSRFTRPFSAGESAVLEQLGVDWEPWRPNTIITYREWFSPDFPLGPAIHGAYVESPSIVAGRFLARYPIDWDRIQRGREIDLLPGETFIADVNIASLKSEANARYEWRFDRNDERRNTWPRPNMPVFATPNGGAAGGRFVRSESFEVRPKPGTDPAHLHLIARVARSRPNASPTANTRILELTATSLDSGLGASTQFAIPEHPEGVLAETRIPLADVLDRAGGDRWRFSLRAVDPPGDAWYSFNYLVVTRKD